MEPLTAPPRVGRLAFTCVVPVHAGDDPAHFDLAMTSIARSTLRPAAVLIAQDGDAPDALRSVVEACVAAGAEVTRNPGAKGLHHNLNHAIPQVRTPWIARADADDINLPDRFARQALYLERNPDVAVLGTGITEFWPDGRRREKRMPPSHEFIVRQAAWRNPINHNTAFVRMDAFADCGGYPLLLQKEDYGLWLTMIGRGYRFANLDALLVDARLGRDFYDRRAGRRNVETELGIYRIKRGVAGFDRTRAALAMAARIAALTARGPARLVYEGLLRR
jgi:glycosyltransferase involved in cell wall biosynthesis